MRWELDSQAAEYLVSLHISRSLKSPTDTGQSPAQSSGAKMTRFSLRVVLYGMLSSGADRNNLNQHSSA